MKKTTIELRENQYFYLLEKALQSKKRGKHATMSSLIREMIDQDMKSAKGKAGR